jgi:hypothetical protein
MSTWTTCFTKLNLVEEQLFLHMDKTLQSIRNSFFFFFLKFKKQNNLNKKQKDEKKKRKEKKLY